MQCDGLLQQSERHRGSLDGDIRTDADGYASTQGLNISNAAIVDLNDRPV